MHAITNGTSGNAARYAYVGLDGVPHFHVWLIPRGADAKEQGWAYIVAARSCVEADARNVAARIRDELKDA